MRANVWNILKLYNNILYYIINWLDLVLFCCVNNLECVIFNNLIAFGLIYVTELNNLRNYSENQFKI